MYINREHGVRQAKQRRRDARTTRPRGPGPAERPDGEDTPEIEWFARVESEGAPAARNPQASRLLDTPEREIRIPEEIALHSEPVARLPAANLSERPRGKVRDGSWFNPVADPEDRTGGVAP